MAARITLELGASERAIKTLQGQLTNTAPLMTQIHAVLTKTVAQNFAVGGRPRWAALKAPGANRQPFAGGLLLRTLSSTVTNTSASLSSNQPFSRLFQYGGTMHLPELTATAGHIFHWRDTRGREVFARHVRARDAKVPARPFLKLQRQDYGTIYTLVERHLVKGQE